MNKYFSYGESIDELWINAIKNIEEFGTETSPRGLKSKELLGHTLILNNPRKRIILNPARKTSPFYVVGELLWYLSGNNKKEFIGYYSNIWNNLSDDGETLNSAYGYRIFTDKHPLIPFNQWEDIKNKLTSDKDSRQAIIHLHTPNNQPTKDEVCTLCLQFFIRDNKLHLHTTMRSNDIIWGTTYDIFMFTFLQEMMSLELGVELGIYTHNVGSLHIYEKHYDIKEKSKFEYSDICSEEDIIIDNKFLNDRELLFQLEDKFRNMEIHTSHDLILIRKLLEKVISNKKLSEYTINIIIILALYKLKKEDFHSEFIKVYSIYGKYLSRNYRKILTSTITDSVNKASKEVK